MVVLLLMGYPGATMCNNLRMNAGRRAVDVAGSDSSLVNLAVGVFSMLADATRVRIILALRGGELAVNQLAGVVAKSPAAVSQHLAKLRSARIVTARPDGTWMFYRLVDEHAAALLAETLLQIEHTLDAPPHHHRRPTRAGR